MTSFFISLHRWYVVKKSKKTVPFFYTSLKAYDIRITDHWHKEVACSLFDLIYSACREKYV